MAGWNIPLFGLTLILLPGNLLADPKADLQKALARYEAGSFREARREFERFLQLYPQDQSIPRVLYNLAQLESNPRDALTYYQTILSEHSRSGVADSALFRIGSYRMASGQYPEAGKAFTHLLRRYPGTPLEQKARYWLALSHLAMNDRVSAIGELKEVLRLSAGSEYGALAEQDLARIEGGLRLSTQEAPLPEISPQGEYLVQVGSFTDFQSALTLRRKLEARGYPVLFDESLVGERTFYRVRVGPYSSQAEAKGIGERLAREEHLQCWIVKRQS